MLDNIRPIGSFESPPDPQGSARAFARFGYDLPKALADIVDNSIDAGARRVAITFHRDDTSVLAVTIGDDGDGMSAEALEGAMRFGVQRRRDRTELGTFGFGMKAASLSQCRSLTVASRHNGRLAACRWTVEAIKTDWSCERLDPNDVPRLLSAASSGELTMSGSGTAVIWQRLDGLGVHEEDIERFLAKLIENLDLHLGLHFHRFIEADRLELYLAARHSKYGLGIPHLVRAYNPFGYKRPGLASYPKSFRAPVKGLGTLILNAHAWPPGSVDAAFRLGRRNPTQLQGFYFYRNDRLIQAGGWNGFLKDASDPELVLARVQVELPDSMAADLVDVSKSNLQISSGLAEALERAQSDGEGLRDYLEACRKLQRQAAKAAEAEEKLPILPGEGMPVGIKRALEGMLAPRGIYRTLDFEWTPLPKRQVFELDRYNDRVLLNQQYREKILGGGRSSAVDAPLFKTMLFLLLHQEAGRGRMSAQRRAWVERCNEILLRAVRAL